ncbi:CusA/CzcA family heavy metal efflux RND transporter [Roseococcus sp. SDR]|nr:efflux RND transporter permease subunit [Roseococcus sp. SDR]MBS7789365.1 efflux RND transporter permease subunit [Roseococcus sp. SDR]MBV1844679.1 CusA/CzcA family heavy metal efflux RND transporter [Roseococcus sp. SDR]
MFNTLVTFSLRNRLFVLVAAMLVTVYGAWTLTRMPVDVFPDLNKPTVVLMTEAEGMAPEEAEQLVSFPIETAVNGLPGVTRVRSVSSVGLSIVYVEFDWGADIWRARQQVNERLGQIAGQLPPRVQPMMAPVSSIMGEIMLVAMTAPADGSVSAMELRTLADWVMRPRLLTIPGVSQVIPIGGEVRQFRVMPDLHRLNALDIDFEALQAALRQFGTNAGGGYVDQAGREFLIRNLGRTTSLEDLRNAPVGFREGQAILLRQVAEVDFGARFRRGDAGVDGGSAVILGIQKQPGADTIRLTQAVEAALADLQSAMPRGVRGDRVKFRQANFIETSIRNLQTVLAEAAVVVAIVLFAFLLNVRTTFISLTAIPLSILLSVIVFSWIGISINTMTLGGIAIAVGELVDDAVVDVENVFRRLGENRHAATPAPILQVIAAASMEVRSGIVYATMIIIMVFLPLFALTGIEGRLFAPLGIAYIVAILASLVVSITVTPVLCYFLLPKMKNLGEHEGWLVRKLKALNDRLLRWAFARRGAVLGVAGIAVLAAGASVPFLPRLFLPAFNEGTVLISLTFQPGISLNQSSELGRAAENIVRQVPEVRGVGRRTGRAELDEHAEGVHRSELDVDLAPSARSRAEVLGDLRDRLAVLPGSVSIGQPISHRLEHMLSGVQAQIALKVFGDDLDTLRALAETIRARLATSVPGLVDLQLERQVRVPQLRIAIDHERASLYGVSTAAILEKMQALTGGIVVSQILEGSRRYDLVMRLADADRTTDSLANALIETPGGRVPLRMLARVEDADGPNQVLREGARRRIVVQANTDGKVDMAQAVAGIRAELARIELPPGYSTSLEGTFQAQEEAMQTIGLLGLLSLAMIFTVLYSRYRSATLALIIMGNVPLALIGAVLAIWISGQPLSVATLVGFVTLTGIAARNGILKISHYLNLALHEGEKWGLALVLRGSAERLTPVLMTALAAGLALIPLTIGADAPGKEILHPVAVTILGGLVSATLLDTFVTPILFHRFGRPALERLRAEADAARNSAPTAAIPETF